MKVHKIILLSSFLIVAMMQAQETVQLEVAPYTTLCGDNATEKCLVLLRTDGSELRSTPLDAIEGFTATEGYEYTLEVTPLAASVNKNPPQYRLIKEVARMWVPQYSVDAPELLGNFQVVGINGRSLDPNQSSIIINAKNSIMRGTTDCSNYHLFFKQLGYSLVFSKILASSINCPGGVMLEQEYFGIFNSVHHFELKGDTLRLYDITDKKLIEARRIR